MFWHTSSEMQSLLQVFSRLVLECSKGRRESSTNSLWACTECWHAQRDTNAGRVNEHTLQWYDVTSWDNCTGFARRASHGAFDFLFQNLSKLHVRLTRQKLIEQISILPRVAAATVAVAAEVAANSSTKSNTKKKGKKSNPKSKKGSSSSNSAKSYCVDNRLVCTNHQSSEACGSSLSSVFVFSHRDAWRWPRAVLVSFESWVLCFANNSRLWSVRSWSAWIDGSRAVHSVIGGQVETTREPVKRCSSRVRSECWVCLKCGEWYVVFSASASFNNISNSTTHRHNHLNITTRIQVLSSSTDQNDDEDVESSRLQTLVTYESTVRTCRAWIVSFNGRSPRLLRTFWISRWTWLRSTIVKVQVPQRLAVYGLLSGEPKYRDTFRSMLLWREQQRCGARDETRDVQKTSCSVTFRLEHVESTVLSLRYTRQLLRSVQAERGSGDGDSAALRIRVAEELNEDDSSKISKGERSILLLKQARTLLSQAWRTIYRSSSASHDLRLTKLCHYISRAFPVVWSNLPRCDREALSDDLVAFRAEVGTTINLEVFSMSQRVCSQHFPRVLLNLPIDLIAHLGRHHNCWFVSIKLWRYSRTGQAAVYRSRLFCWTKRMSLSRHSAEFLRSCVILSLCTDLNMVLPLMRRYYAQSKTSNRAHHETYGYIQGARDLTAIQDLPLCLWIKTTRLF